MDITVAICTWNRAKLLDMTLEQMRKLRIPAGVEWEILVVNNRCSDNTDEVIQKHAADLPVKRLFEQKQGHSNARNCAAAAARGDLVVWTDDDVLVDEDWLVAYLEAARQWPQAGYFGGTVDPLYEVDPPAWVHRHPRMVEGPFALRQLGGEVRPLVDPELPFGANMAFRRSVLPELPFDPKFGRVGKIMTSEDETQLFERLKEQRVQGIWVGKSRVRHFIPRERLTTKYIWNFRMGMGATSVRRSGLPEGKYWFNVPRWMIRAYASHRWASLISAWRKDARWAESYSQAAFLMGAMKEAVRQRKLAAIPAFSDAEASTATRIPGSGA